MHGHCGFLLAGALLDDRAVRPIRDHARSLARGYAQIVPKGCVRLVPEKTQVRTQRSFPQPGADSPSPPLKRAAFPGAERGPLQAVASQGETNTKPGLCSWAA